MSSITVKTFETLISGLQETTAGVLEENEELRKQLAQRDQIILDLVKTLNLEGRKLPSVHTDEVLQKTEDCLKILKSKSLLEEGTEETFMHYLISEMLRINKSFKKGLTLKNQDVQINLGLSYFLPAKEARDSLLEKEVLELKGNINSRKPKTYLLGKVALMHLSNIG